jgi:hypothetical protein
MLLEKRTADVGKPVPKKRIKIGAHNGLSAGSTPNNGFLAANSKSEPVYGWCEGLPS